MLGEQEARKGHRQSRLPRATRPDHGDASGAGHDQRDLVQRRRCGTWPSDRDAVQLDTVLRSMRATPRPRLASREGCCAAGSRCTGSSSSSSRIRAVAEVTAFQRRTASGNGVTQVERGQWRENEHAEEDPVDVASRNSRGSECKTSQHGEASDEKTQ